MEQFFKKMRSFISLIILSFFVLYSCNLDSKKNTETTTNTVELSANLKGSDYTNLEGKDISLNDYKGKKILLNYWATWCRPCIEEMPSLERAQLLLEKDDYVVLLAANHSIKEIKEFKAKTDFKLNFIRFTGDFSGLKIYALPTTFIFNEEGMKITEITGATEWDSPEIIQKLKSVN